MPFSLAQGKAKDGTLSVRRVDSVKAGNVGPGIAAFWRPMDKKYASQAKQLLESENVTPDPCLVVVLARTLRLETAIEKEGGKPVWEILGEENPNPKPKTETKELVGT